MADTGDNPGTGAAKALSAYSLRMPGQAARTTNCPPQARTDCAPRLSWFAGLGGRPRELDLE